MKIENVLIGVLMVALVSSGFYITAQDFWTAYDYTPPTNDLTTKFNYISEIDNTNKNMTDAITKIDTNNPLGFLNGVVQSATNAIQAFFTMLSVPVELLGQIGLTLGVPEIITKVFIIIVSISIIMAIIYLFYTRNYLG